MEIKQEKTGDLTGRLTVVVAPEDYRDQVNTVLKDYAKRANIKGFRQGHVPTSVMRKMFGKGVIYEELNKIVSAALTDFIKEERLALVGEPLPVTNDLELTPESDVAYELAFEIGMSEPFVVNYELAGTHPLYKVVADDALIDKEVEGLRTQHGEMSNPEESAEGDTLFGKIYEVDAEGNAIAGGLERMFALNPERVQSEALKAEMGRGKKADDVLSVTMADIFDEDDDIRELWEKTVSGEQIRTLSDAEIADIKTKKFAFEVRKINHVDKLPLDQELFSKVLGPGESHTLADFRDRVASDIERHLNEQAMRLYRALTIRALVEKTPIELPHDFMRKWLIATREQINEGNVDQLYDSFLRSYKWRMIVEQMQEHNEQVRVTQDHIKARALAMIKAQFGTMLGDDDSRLDGFADYYLKDEKMVERLFDEELEDRVFFHIRSQAEPRQEETTATDFLEIVKRENASSRA